MTTKRIFLWLLLLGLACSAPMALAEDGYDLWLRYRPLPAEWLEAYHRRTTEVIPGTPSPTLDLAAAELSRGLGGLLGAAPPVSSQPSRDGSVIFGTVKSSPLIAGMHLGLDRIGAAGYVIRSTTLFHHSVITIAANEDIGVLYGTFHFLRLLQTRQSLEHLD